MRTANIALKVDVDDTKLVGHSAHVKELAALLKAVSVQGTATFTGIGTAAGLSASSVRKLMSTMNKLNSTMIDVVDALKKYNAVSVTNTTNIQNNTLALTQNNNTLNQANINIDKFAINTAKATAAIAKKEKQTISWWMAIRRASATLFSIQYLGKTVFDTIQKSAERIDLKTTLTNQFVNLEGKIDEIKFKTANMIDREAIMRSMALMSSFNLPMQNFADQVELINKMAIRTGQSTTYMMDSFARGISRLSAPILDNLGIQVVLKDVYAEFAASIGKSTDELTKMEKQMAVTNYTLGIMKEKTEGIELSETIAAQVRSVKNDLKEFADDVTDGLTEVGVTVGKAFRMVFGSDTTNYIASIREKLSDVSKELVEYKKVGLDTNSSLYKSKLWQMKQYKEEIAFLMQNRKIQEQIFALKKLIGNEVLSRQEMEVLNGLPINEQSLSALENRKEWLKRGPAVVRQFYTEAFNSLLLGDNSFTAKEKELFQSRIDSFINQIVTPTVDSFTASLTGEEFEVPYLIDRFLGDPKNLPNTYKTITDFISTIKQAVGEGLADQKAFEEYNKYVVKAADSFILAAKEQQKLVLGATALEVSLNRVNDELSKSDDDYKKAVKNLEKILEMEGEHDEKYKETLQTARDQVLQKAGLVVELVKEKGFLESIKKLSEDISKTEAQRMSEFRTKISTLNKAELDAQRLLLDTAIAKTDAESLGLETTKLSIRAMVDAAASFAAMYTPIIGLIKGVLADTLSDAVVNDLTKKLELIDKRAKELRGRSVEEKYEGETFEDYIALQIRIQEMRRKMFADKLKITEELGILMEKIRETRDVEEVAKLFTEYEKLSKVAKELGIDLKAAFPSQDDEINRILDQSTAILILGRSFENAATGVSKYRDIMKDFIGEDIQDGLSQFADNMNKFADATKKQLGVYNQFSAVAGMMQSFTNVLIKDKKKLAWVNMVFEAGQAWAAAATPGMQHLAITHGIAAMTFGLIAGGVLRLPSGTGARNPTKENQTPPPIIINVDGDIAQTEADRGVMIQRSLDEARRMGRI